MHRGVYELAERATAGYEGARETVAHFLNAPSSREVIFTRNATEGINLVAYAWGLNNLGPGDVVLVTELEHHSNFVPWQYIAGRTGADFRMLPLDDQGELRLDALDEVAGDGRVRVVAAGMVSNSLGTVNPVEKLAAWAHEHGAIMVATLPRARRIGSSTCRRSAPTSSLSPRTSSAGQAGSARSGDGWSCSRRWSPSTSAAT